MLSLFVQRQSLVLSTYPRSSGACVCEALVLRREAAVHSRVNDGHQAPSMEEHQPAGLT